MKQASQLTTIHGYWYRNWEFPFFHYKKPILIILKGNKVYSWNGEIWIKIKSL